MQKEPIQKNNHGSKSIIDLTIKAETANFLIYFKSHVVALPHEVTFFTQTLKL
jgi:hypothetical protein